MEPSGEELGAFNLSQCQRLWENRRQWVLQEEVGRVQDGILVPDNEDGRRWTQWARSDPGIGSALDMLCGHGQVSYLLCFLIYKMRMLERWAYMKVPTSLDTIKEPGRWQRTAVRVLGIQTNQVHSSTLSFISCGIMQASSSPALIYPSVQWG